MIIEIMRNTGWDINKAMDVGGISESDRNEIEALVHERMDGRTA